MELKSDPSNYILNYDDSDEDDDDEDDDDSSLDDDDSTDQDFDDEAEDDIIEPIIGNEQLNLINVMKESIKHPERFREKILHDATEKMPLCEKYGAIEGVIGRGSYGVVSITGKCDPKDKKKKSFFAVKQLKKRPGESLNHFIYPVW
ncbi:unnamed protein product [Ambrosiozyma monospora]|uniref:Unnamed protein product n=1 Tax=Ambrosiozyma monospora TaxID=43982 RepID=A0ACB5U1A3_AMBMO|nr:unnamed protein product [Ambrosiozyma monospora]